MAMQTMDPISVALQPTPPPLPTPPPPPPPVLAQPPRMPQAGELVLGRTRLRSPDFTLLHDELIYRSTLRANFTAASVGGQENRNSTGDRRVVSAPQPELAQMDSIQDGPSKELPRRVISAVSQGFVGGDIGSESGNATASSSSAAPLSEEEEAMRISRARRELRRTLRVEQRSVRDRIRDLEGTIAVLSREHEEAQSVLEKLSSNRKDAERRKERRQQLKEEEERERRRREWSDCVVCMESFEIAKGKIVRLENCGCGFCRGCLSGEFNVFLYNLSLWVEEFCMRMKAFH
jgi:hypothetical protein